MTQASVTITNNLVDDLVLSSINVSSGIVLIGTISSQQSMTFQLQTNTYILNDLVDSNSMAFEVNGLMVNNPNVNVSFNNSTNNLSVTNSTSSSYNFYYYNTTDSGFGFVQVPGTPTIGTNVTNQMVPGSAFGAITDNAYEGLFVLSNGTINISSFVFIYDTNPANSIFNGGWDITYANPPGQPSTITIGGEGQIRTKLINILNKQNKNIQIVQQTKNFNMELPQCNNVSVLLQRGITYTVLIPYKPNTTGTFAIINNQLTITKEPESDIKLIANNSMLTITCIKHKRHIHQ